MYEASDTMEGSPTYSKGDIVWVKLSSYWWPGEVINEDDLPGDLLSDFKRPPLVIVKFFDEDSYEYVRNWLNVNPYDCPKKADFIKKGMAGFRAKLSHMAKFPKDIGTAEEKTNGNPNILSQPEFLPVKKVNYDEIFGTPSPKKSAKGKVSLPSSKKTPARDSNQPHITHRRFLGNDDYRAYICVQYPGKDRKWDSDDEEIKKLNEESEKVLSCHSCSFKTKRLEVMILHTKMHIQGIYVTSKRKAKKSKGIEAGSDSESDIVAAKSPKPKQRKKKQVKPKTADVFANLLGEWDETDEEMEEESVTSKKPPKAKKKPVSVEKQLPKKENQISNDDQSQESKLIATATTASDISVNTDPDIAEPVKNTQDDIKNCFDFDEEEEDDDFLMPTSTGRKIPRVIPEKPKPSISELLEQSQKEDDLKEENSAGSVDDTEKLEPAATENGTDGNKKEILKTNQSLNRDLDIDDNIENTFKELMAETELPTLDGLGQNLKPEQNFHDARTVKFPDKGGTTLKGGAFSKSGTSKKRFVTSFEDFEAGFRKLEDEKQNTKKPGGDKEVNPTQMLNAPRIDDGKEDAPLKLSEEIAESKGSEEALAEVATEVKTSTIDAEVPEKHTYSKKSRTRHSARVKEIALSESAEPQSETISPSVEETTAKQPDVLHSVGRRKTRQSDKEKPETEAGQQADVKEPNQDTTSEETIHDSRRKSSRRLTKQFVIEEDSEEIIEITREGDSDVMDSSEEGIHLDEKTKKELAAIDLEIENLKRSLDIAEGTPEEEECQETSNQISDKTEQVVESTTKESVEVDSSEAIETSDTDNCNLLKEMMESTEHIEIIQDDEVPKKSYRTTRHSSSTAHLQKTEEKKKQWTEHDDKTPSKSQRRVSQRTYLKNEPPSDSVDDLSSKSTLEVSCTETKHIVETSESIVTEPEPTTIKGKRGRTRAHQKDIESNLIKKEIPKCIELNVDDTKSKIVKNLEEPIVSSDLIEPLPSKEKVDIGSNKSESESIATESEPPTTKGRKVRPRGHQKDVESELREKEVLKCSELNIDNAKSKTIETLEEPAVSSNEPPSKEVDVLSHHREEPTLATFSKVNTDQSMGAQQEPKSTTLELPEQKNRDQPDEINTEKLIAPESTPRSKKGKTRRHTKEASQDQIIISLEESAPIDMKLAGASVESSDLDTQKSEVKPTESESVVPELASANPIPESTSSSKRSKTRKHTKEASQDQTIISLEESAPTDMTLSEATVESYNVDTQKSEVNPTESQSIGPELANSSPIPESTSSSKRGKARSHTKDVSHDETISLEESAPLAMKLAEASVESSDLDIQESRVYLTESKSIVPEFSSANAIPEVLEAPTPKTRRGRSQKLAKEAEVPAGRESTDNVAKTEVPEPKQEVTNMAVTEIAELSTGPVAELHDEPTPRTRRGKHRKHLKEKEHVKPMEEHPIELESKPVEVSTVEPDVTLQSIPDVPDLTHKTRRSKSRKDTIESEQDKPASREKDDNDAVLLTEHVSAEMAKTEIVTVKEQTIIDIENSTSGSETVEPEPTKISSTDSTIEEGLNFLVEAPKIEAEVSIPDVDVPIPTPRKSTRRKHIEEEQVSSAVAEDIPKNVESVPMEVSQEAPLESTVLEVNEEKVVDVFSAPEIAGEVENVEINVSDVSEESNLKLIRGRPKKLAKEQELLETESQEANNKPISESIKQAETHSAVLETSDSKLIEHPTPKSRRSRTRKYAKVEESTSHTHTTQTKQTIENTETRTVEVPSFSMPEELFSKTRRGRSRKLTQEEEDFARAIQESLKDMAQGQNQVAIDQTHPESSNLTESDKSSADTAVDAFVQIPSKSSRKSKKGKSRKNSKSQEHASTIQNEILSKDASSDDTQAVLSTDSNKQKDEITTVPEMVSSIEMENTSVKVALDQSLHEIPEQFTPSTRRGRTRKHAKEEQQSEIALSKDPKNTEEAPKQIDESGIIISETAQDTSLKPTISDAVELPEQPTPKSKRGRPRKHAVQEDILLATPIEEPSQIANEIQSKELTAALEFTKTVLELVENQLVVGNAEAVVEAVAQEGTEQKDILMETRIEEPALKVRRGRSRRHTQNEEALTEDISKTIPSERSDVAMSDVIEHSSLIIKNDIRQESTGDFLVSEVGYSFENTVAEATVSESKIPEEPPLKTKKGRPRKHIEENTESIIESGSISLEPEPKLPMVEPPLKTEFQAAELDAHMKDECCVVTEPNEKDLGSMGSIIQTAVDQSFSTLDHIPKSGLSEWVGELLKISSKEEGRTDVNKEQMPTEAISNQCQKVPEPAQLEVPADVLTVQENASLESNIDLELNNQERKLQVVSVTESTISAPEPFGKPVNKRNRRRSKESMKKEIAPTLEKCQTSSKVTQEIVVSCAKPELAAEQVLENQLKTVPNTAISDQTDSASIQAVVDTSSKKNDHIITETLSTEEPESSMALIKKNDTPSAKGRRGRPRKSMCSETLPIGESPGIPQSKPKIIEEGSAFKEINDANKPEVVDTLGHYKLDQLPIPETTKQIDNDVKSSVHTEIVKMVPETSVQKFTDTEKMDILNTLKEPQTKTTSQLPAAVPEVVKPTVPESVGRKGPKTIILNRKRIEMNLQSKPVLLASVENVESSVFKTGYIEPSKTQKSLVKTLIKKKSEVDDADSSQVAFKKVLKQKFKDIVSNEADKDAEVIKSIHEQGPKDSGPAKNITEYIPMIESRSANDTHLTATLFVKEDSIGKNVEQVVIQETSQSLESHIPQSKRSRPRRNSKQDSSSLVAPDVPGTSDQKAILSEEKSRHVPPKKNKWSRRGSYGKSVNDVDNLLKEQVVDSVPETVVSEEDVIEEHTVETNAAIETEAVVTGLKYVSDQNEEKSLAKNANLEETNHSETVPKILDHSFTDFNDSDIILPPKKSKRATDVKYNFLNDSFASNTFSSEKKADCDILSFPTCDDSIMSTSLRNNIEGLIKDIDNFDSSNVSDNLNITVKDDGEKVAVLEIPKTESAKSEVNLFSSTDSGEFIKEPAGISKCVPPKKKKIEYLQQDVASSFVNSLLSNDINKTEEELDVRQPPKKKIQKLFETSQALEKVGKVSDIPQMSPLAKKKSFLFHPEEFAQKVAEITQQIEVAAMREPEKNIDNLYNTNLKIGETPISSLDSKEVEADVSKTLPTTVPKKRQKRKSSSYGDHLQKKERRTSSETFDTNAEQESNIVLNIDNEQIVSQLEDQKQVLDTVKTSATDPCTLDDNLTIPGEHKNEMEVKIVDDDFKFSIQTNLTNIATSTAEELSVIATATLSEMKNEVKEDGQAKQTEVGAKEEIIEPEVKEEYTMAHIPAGVAEVSSESEFVPISINPTVMSEKDLADAQVEITTDKVISEKKPTNLGMFSMDFLESSHPVKVHTIKIKKTELMGSPKTNNTSGTEFTSKAMTKEFDNRALITQPKAYALKSELLDILEGNSNSSTNSSGSDQKFKTSFDNYDKQTVVQGMFDFEDAIPSQIVLSNKVNPETVLIDSPKLLERLSMANDANTAKPKKVLIQSDNKIPENVPKGLVTRVTKPMGTPKPGQKIIIKTTKAQPLPMSKTTGNKPIILSEQIIRPANVPKPVIQPQGIKRQYEDIEDVETAFIIPKIAKKAIEEEVMPEVVPDKLVRGRGSKASGKAKILQQTIITPKGEIVQSQTPTTTSSTTSALIETDQPENDDMVFDINSMPIVLSDDLLTPESIQNMPVVLSEDVIPHGKPITVKAEEKLIPALARKGLSGVTSKQQIVFKTTLSGPTMPLQAKQITKPRILSTTPASAMKVKPPTALLATGTSVDGKPTKYVLVPSTVASSVPQVKQVKPPVIKKHPPLPPKIPTIQTNEPQSPIVGNKIMIVTNQHGQQTRVVLTPQQQKAFIQSQPGSKTKTIIKGAIPKALLESASAGPSGIVQKTQLSNVPQGIAPTVSSQGGLLMTVGKGAKTLVHPKKGPQRAPGKPQKTILIKNQMGQTVRKIQGTDDADLDRQVAEQLEAIKASARLQQANKSPEIINYTNRHIASSTIATKAPVVRRPQPKKVEPIKVKPSVPTPQVQSQKSQENLIPALAPLSPQQVHSQTSPNLQKQAPVKLDLPSSSPGNKTTDTRLQQQPILSTKSESKPPVASAVGAENKPADRPLTQLVIQDGLGNQTTITEGQILAIPSETVDGQPQSYMLVTLDEMGNITPLNNEALMSLDPSLGLGGDLNNMVLQVDQGQGTVAALKPAESSVPVANTEQNKIAERLQLPQPVPEPKHVPVEQPKPQEVPMAVEQQIVIGEGVLPGADSGGQQLIVTGDPIATQKFLESLSDGSTDLANILANAEGGSVLIQADGQQILIKTNTGSQPLLGISENTEAGGNPIFGSHKPNQDILAAALANTDVFPSSDQPTVHSSPIKGMQSSQLSPSGGSGVLYPMHVGNVLETSLTLNSPIMTPLEVPSLPNKKIDDDVDILTQVSKNVDLPITITDPNISQTVAQQQAIGLMELTLPISETTGSGDINSPNYSYSLPSLEDSVSPAQKPFNGSMPLLTEDVTEVESNGSSQLGKIRVAKGLQSTETTFSPNYGNLPLLPDTIESSREEVVKTSCFGEIGSLPMLAEDVIEDSGSSRGSSKQQRSSPKNLERDMVDEGLSTLGGEMCSSLSEPPPDMFDLASITAKEEEISSDLSSIPEPEGEGETLSLHSENSGEIPIQPPIVANFNDLKRPGDDTLEQDEKRQKFD